MSEPDRTTSAAEREQEPVTVPESNNDAGGGGGGGWGGWGFSPLSYLSDLQKAAEDISRNAVAAAQTAAKSIADFDNVSEDSESSKREGEGEGEGDDAATERQDGREEEKVKSALDKLEKASEDTFLSQGLKVIDDSVENFASEAWKALGSALKGGSDFIQKLEHSAANISESVQHGSTVGSLAPSLLETGRAFTYKGIQVLENVSKETMELLISETGIEVDKNSDGAENQGYEEEMTFDRCFYIYGGPEQLEELEALASHYTLLFNRRKAKLTSEQKSFYEGMVKQVQEILDLKTTDSFVVDLDKGKKKEGGAGGSDSELKSLHDASVSKAADLAAGFTSALTGLAASDIIQRTAGRLDSLHSEGVHRLSEVCCFAVSQLFTLGKSIISAANKSLKENASGDPIKIEWPDDSVDKAKIIRSKAQSMCESLEAVSNSFITGISDVTESYIAAIKDMTTDTQQAPPKKSVQDKANVFSEYLRADQRTAISKIQDGLQHLCYVLVSTSMPPA